MKKGKKNEADTGRLIAGIAQMALGGFLVAIPDPAPGLGPSTAIGAPIFLSGVATLYSGAKK